MLGGMEKKLQARPEIVGSNPHDVWVYIFSVSLVGALVPVAVATTSRY